MKRLRPPTIVLVALAVTLLFAVLHLLGARRSTAALSGIFGDPVDATLALLYVGTWFFSALVTPIVLVAWTIAKALTPRDPRALPSPRSHPSPPAPRG